ncbi:ribonuclease H-like domain, reverse transcriptase, RNA-dependent DNA polymerase [Tanacetum coccineum]
MQRFAVAGFRSSLIQVYLYLLVHTSRYVVPTGRVIATVSIKVPTGRLEFTMVYELVVYELVMYESVVYESYVARLEFTMVLDKNKVEVLPMFKRWDILQETVQGRKMDQRQESEKGRKLMLLMNVSTDVVVLLIEFVNVAAGVGADGVSITSSDATDAETQFALMGLSSAGAILKKMNDLGTQDTNTHAGTHDDSDSECDEQVIVVPSFPSNHFSGPKVHTASATVESSSDYAEELARLQGQAYEANSAAKVTWKTADTVPAGSGSIPAGSINQAAGGFAVPSTPSSSVVEPVHADTPLPPGHSLGSSENSTRFVPHLLTLVKHNSIQLQRWMASPSSYYRYFPLKSTYDAEILVGFSHKFSTTIGNKHTDYLHFPVVLFSYAQLETKQVLAQALNDPDWVEAMQEEMQQFVNQDVWKLVPLPEGKTAIGTKWILKNKRDARVARLKHQIILSFASYMPRQVCQDMLRKFWYGSVRPSTTPYEALSPKSKDEPDDVFKVHLSRSNKGFNLLYLTAIKARYYVCKPKPKHVSMVPKRFSLYVLEAYSDSDYAGSNGDRNPQLGKVSSAEQFPTGCLFWFPYCLDEVVPLVLLHDEGGIVDMPIPDIFLGMDNLGYPTEGNLTFHKTNSSPQLRFLQMMLDIETRHTKPYHAIRLTSKMFANMRLNFHGDHIPLVAAMLPPPQGLHALLSPHDHGSTSPRPTPTTPASQLNKPVSKPPRPIPTSDPHVESSSKENDSNPNPNMADDPLEIFHFASPSSPLTAPPRWKKIGSLESELQAHKLLFKDVLVKAGKERMEVFWSQNSSTRKGMRILK